MQEHWLSWLNWNDEAHCEWALTYLLKKRLLTNLGGSGPPSRQLGDEIRRWPIRRSRSPNAASNPHFFLGLETNMRAAYTQWVKRRETKTHKTYNLWMTRDVGRPLKQLARRQRMSISDSVEDLIRRESTMAADFQRSLEDRLSEAHEDHRAKRSRLESKIDLHRRVIDELIDRVANLEVGLDLGPPDPNGARQSGDPNSKERWEALVINRKDELQRTYTRKLSRMARPSKLHRPHLKRAAPGDPAQKPTKPD